MPSHLQVHMFMLHAFSMCMAASVPGSYNVISAGPLLPEQMFRDRQEELLKLLHSVQDS